ncbi:MAG: D-alanyl-D-alanine carboxypeptidase/D-alanyl-D-alanine endopeptidase [Gemmatimonadota bacterium]
MNPAKATASLLLIGAFAPACAKPAPPTPEVRRQEFVWVADSLVHYGLRSALWGIEVWDQGRNQRLYGHNFDKQFIPASNTKLVVTTVALGLLGPDWRYATPIMVAGAPRDSAPRALIVKATGDPSWSARFHGGELAVLDSIADSLAVNGIRRIAGDLIIDASAFARQRVHPSWETGDLPWYYAAPTAALGVSEAAVRMIVAANGVRFEDGFAPAPVVQRVRTDTAGARNNIDIDYEAWPDTIIVVGSIAPDRADSSWIAQPVPEQYAAQALIQALARKQIEVTGSIRIVYDRAEAAALPAARTVTTWHSPPLHEIVAAILKPSQNWIAEQLLKTLGYLKGNEGSWREGLAVERRYLIDVVKIDSTVFSLSDGSGLSAHNLLAPHAVTTLLEHARTAPWGAQYHAALPAPGSSGTLSSRLRGLEQRVAAKTGTIANVTTLSGYVRAADGRDLTFSILTNASGRGASAMRNGIDALVRALARAQNWE